MTLTANSKNGLKPGTTYSVGTDKGTASPSKKAEDAAKSNTASTKGVKPIVPGGPVTIGVDAQGNPIRSSEPLYQQGQQYTYLTSLPQNARADIQRKMYSLGVYGKNFVPTYGFISPGGEDAAAIAKLMFAGEQLGLADINDVIKRAQKDSKVRTLITTGGTVSQGTKLNLTDAATAGATLTKYYLDTFNEKPTKSEITDYTNKLNSAEKAAKGSIGSDQQDSILMGIVAAKANTLITSAKAGNVGAQNKLDAGQLGKTIRAIRSAYEDNGLPQPSDPTVVYKKAVEALRDQSAYDNVMEGIKVSAKNVWTPFAADIANGHTVKDLIGSHLSLKSNILGKPSSDIKISDMTDAIDANGKLKTLDAYKQELYKSKEYLASNNYKQQLYDDYSAIMKNFQIG